MKNRKNYDSKLIDWPPGDPNPYVLITQLGKEFLEYLRTNNYAGEEKDNI